MSLTLGDVGICSRLCWRLSSPCSGFATGGYSPFYFMVAAGSAVLFVGSVILYLIVSFGHRAEVAAFAVEVKRVMALGSDVDLSEAVRLASARDVRRVTNTDVRTYRLVDGVLAERVEHIAPFVTVS